MRRGQITIFVIIGVLILAVVGLFLLVPEERKATTLTSTEESNAVTALVQQCLSQVGEQSIVQVGAQGGYAEFSSLQDIPTQDTQVITMPLQKIPLWHEVHSCQSKNGCIGDNHPALCKRGDSCPISGDRGDGDVSFQESIELLVERNLASCFNGFSSMPNVEVEAQGEPEVRAVIREQDVMLILEYPLLLSTTDGQEVDLNEFTSSVSVNLPQAYELARKIQLTQREQQFLEVIFLDMIEIYGGIDGPLPPFRDTQFQGAPRSWLRSDVQRTFERDILPFLNFVQVVNAERSYVPIQSPDVNVNYSYYADGVYEHMSVQLDDVSYPLSAAFEYPNTPMHLDINGKEYLKPRRMPDTGVFKFLGLDIRDYRFKYSAAFPVVVRIHDETAFNGKGFTLNLGLEGNVKNNHPLNTSQNTIELDLAAESIDLGEEAQLVDHSYEVTIIDNRAGTPITDAILTYACGNEYSLGITDSRGQWEGRMPYCISGGHIVVMKEGYLRTSKEQSNFEPDGGRDVVDIGMWPLENKTIAVYKRTAIDSGNVTVGGDGHVYRTPLAPNDSAIIQIARIKESAYEDDVPLVGALKFGGSTPGDAVANSIPAMRQTLDDLLARGTITAEEHAQLQEDLGTIEITDDGEAGPVIHTQSVQLAPGDYVIEGTLIYAGEIEIPAKRKCESALDGLKKTCYTLDAQNFSSWVSGGVILKDGDILHLEPADVYGDKNLTLYVLEMSFTNKQTYWCKQTACTNGCTVPELADASVCLADWKVERACEMNATSTAVNETCMTQMKTDFPKQITGNVHTPFPIDWDDVMQYQEVAKYQNYRRAAIRPEME